MWFTLILMGCSGKESTGAWLEHSSYNWLGANHRLSHYEMGVSEEDVYVAMIGGTSTTGVFEPLDAGCEQATCDEFPILDRAEVEIGWAKTTSKDAVFGSGSTDIVVDADGESGTIEISLPHKAKGTANAVLRGWKLNTDEPLSGGTSCYRPKNGWLPKGLSISLGEATLSADGLSVTVPVSGSFEAGLTYEHERECLDAVIDQAQVGLNIDVLAVVSSVESERIDVSHDLEYAYTGNRGDPGPQPDPDFAARTLGSTFESPLTGWSSIDFAFHEVGETRGAYLRTLRLHVGPGDEAWGHATNFSPGTQLSGFDYDFSGTVTAIDLDDEITRGRVEETFPVTLTDEGAAEQFRFSH